MQIDIVCERQKEIERVTGRLADRQQDGILTFLDSWGVWGCWRVDVCYCIGLPLT